MNAEPLQVAVAGPGTIGLAVCQLVHAQPSYNLVGTVGRSHARTVAALAAHRIDAPSLDLTEAADLADVVVDTAPPSAFEPIAGTTVEAGKVLVTVNSGTLLEHLHLIEAARKTGGRIVVATGAVVGLDAVRAAAIGKIHRAHMITRKPARAFRGIPHVAELGIDIDALTKATLLYRGSVRDGIRHYPSNVNVAVSLALAGIGANATTLEIWADPELERNTHEITVDAEAATFEMRIQNVPTEENPATGRLTALSVFDAVRGLAEPLRIGS